MAEAQVIGKSYNEVEAQYQRARSTALRAWREGRMTVSEVGTRLGNIDRIGARYLNNIDRATNANSTRRVPRSVYMQRRNNR